MDKELQTYFDNYLEMFATLGWKQLMSDLEDTLSSQFLMQMIGDAKTERDLGVIQGQLNKTQQWLTFETQLVAACEAAKQDAGEDE